MKKVIFLLVIFALTACTAKTKSDQSDGGPLVPMPIYKDNCTTESKKDECKQSSGKY